MATMNLQFNDVLTRKRVGLGKIKTEARINNVTLRGGEHAQVGIAWLKTVLTQGGCYR